MQISASFTLFICSILTLVDAGRNYKRLAQEKLVHRTFAERNIKHWSPLPRKPSESQCALALERAIKQPRTCAEKYLTPAVRTINSPIYDWFDLPNLVNTALQYALDNAVGIKVYDAFRNELASISVDGQIQPVPVGPVPIKLTAARTWPLNLPTYTLFNDISIMATNVWSSRADLLLINIFKLKNTIPQVC